MATNASAGPTIRNTEPAAMLQPLLRTLVCLLIVAQAIYAQGELPDLSQGRRVALVIGNRSYTKFPALKNPINDAKDMALALQARGFEVTSRVDLNAVEFERILLDFKVAAKGADVALFFYAGHGFQMQGENYLLPVDAGSSDELVLKHQSISCEFIRDLLEPTASLKIFVFDSCRDNPFSATRSTVRGLNRMEGKVGTLIALATSPGSTASDDPTSRNGLYTKNLLAALQDSQLDFRQTFDRAGQTTYAESNREQQPWVSASVIPFVFRFNGSARTIRGAQVQLPASPVKVSPVNVGKIQGNTYEMHVSGPVRLQYTAPLPPDHTVGIHFHLSVNGRSIGYLYQQGLTTNLGEGQNIAPGQSTAWIDLSRFCGPGDNTVLLDCRYDDTGADKPVLIWFLQGQLETNR